RVRTALLHACSSTLKKRVAMILRDVEARLSASFPNHEAPTHQEVSAAMTLAVVGYNNTWHTSITMTPVRACAAPASTIAREIARRARTRANRQRHHERASLADRERSCVRRAGLTWRPAQQRAARSPL